MQRSAEEEEGEEEEEEGGEEMMLTPGRHQGKRVRLGSADKPLSTFNTPLMQRPPATMQESPLGAPSSSSRLITPGRQKPTTPRRVGRDGKDLMDKDMLPAVLLGEKDEMNVTPDKVPYRLAGPLLSDPLDEDDAVGPLRKGKASRRIVGEEEESEDENVLTPRSIREG